VGELMIVGRFETERGKEAEVLKPAQ
jgi:hypothetical protein